jgi:hypothetical protein
MRTVLSIGIGVVLSLLLFGVLVQITDNNDYELTHIDPTTGLALYTQNGSFKVLEGCFENTVKINNLGFHGRDVSPEKEKDVYRIVILGSSFIEARQVGVEQMFASVLQDKLNATPNKKYQYEVIPIAINGNKPIHDALYYLYYGRPLKPDLVINFQTQWELTHFDGPNPEASLDAQGNALLKVPPASDTTSKKSSIERFLRKSKLVVNLYNRYLLLKGNMLDYLKHPLFFTRAQTTVQTVDELAAEERTHWKQLDASDLAFAHLVAQDHAKFLFATAYAPEPNPTISPKELYAHANTIATQAHVPYVDMQPRMDALEAATGKPATLLPCEGHWSAQGNEYAAESMLEYLTAHPELTTR